MKRRNIDTKLRRTIKRNNGNSSALFYFKIVLIWSIVIFVDYLAELRFEYLWPFWLLIRSVFDSYKYKGLAFSFLFICIAITSDLICLFLIPLNWIFFVASIFVWIQFIWLHTEKFSLPTILIWLLFVWMEAKVRWKDNQKMPHLDLCRPFAAHCIGYPVVSLGFGFKSYLSYKIRQRKQKEIAKENEFYMELLQKALPQEVEKNQEQIETSSTSITSNGNISQCKPDQTNQKNHVNVNGSIDNSIPSANVNGTSSHTKHHNLKKNAEKENGYLQNVEQHNNQDLPNNIVLTKSGTKANNLNFNNLQTVKNTNTTSYQQIQNGIQKELNNKCSPYKNNTYNSSNACKKEYEKEKIIKDSSYEETNVVESSNQKKKEKQKDNQQYHQQHQASNNSSNEKVKVCEQCSKLEQEAKRLKSENVAMKSFEQEMKQKLEVIKGSLSSKQKEHEEAQKQISELQQLQLQERRNRQFYESQIKELKEKKNRKPADEKPIIRCPESCKVKKMQIENENQKLRRDIMLIEETKQNLEKLLYEQSLELRKYDRSRDQNQSADLALRTALAVMQEKNVTLEKNLSAETRVKLDLFSALGNAQRQLEIKDDCLRKAEKQLENLQAQILAVSSNFADVTNSQQI